MLTIMVFFTGGNLLKWMFRKNKKSIFLLIMIVLFIAGLLDIKYEGLFFQLLPGSIQSYLAPIF